MGKTYDYPLQLRWSDADRQGHVNNGKFATFAEDARIDWFEHLPGREANAPSSGLILARQEIDYHRQVRTEAEAGKRMVVKCSTLSLGRTSARIREELWGEGDTSPACTVDCVLVNFDYEAGASTPWTDAEREWIASFAAQEN